MVPHGPGGQMLRPAPRHPYIPPSARANRRPRSGSHLFHPRPAPYRPTARQIRNARAQARGYRSQGQMVERDANRKNRAARQRVIRNRALAQERYYRSLGQAIERAANRANVQTNMARLRPGPTLRDIGHFLSGPAKIQAAAPLQAQVGFTGGRAVSRDALSLGTLPFLGSYQLGAAAYEASPIRNVFGGRPNLSRAKKLGAGIVKGYEQEIKHPIRSLQQHPLITALDIAGAESVIGRTAGAGLRAIGKTAESGGLRGAAARAGSTVRSPLALTHDRAGGTVNRTYSKDTIRKALQVQADRLRTPLRDSSGNPVTVVDRGRRVQVLRPTELGRAHLAHRRGDQLAGRGIAREQMIRDHAADRHTVGTPTGARARNRAAVIRAAFGGEPAAAKAIGLRGRHTRDIVALAVQGGITSARHLEGDLRGYVARLEREYQARIGEKGFRNSGEARQNRKNVALARKVLNSPRALAQAGRIVAEAERHGRALNAADVAKGAAGIDEPARMRRAALEVPAIEHMGARHFTVREHAQLEREAARVEKAAAERYAEAKPGDRGAALADLRAAREHRIAVSGRHPARTRAHEFAKERAAQARSRAKKAQAAQARAESRVRALSQRHRSERASKSGGSPNLLAAADQGVEAVRAGVDRTKVQLDRLATSMHRASARGDSAKIEEIQGHIETLSARHAEELARLRGLEKQRDLFRATPQRAYYVGDKRFERRAEADAYVKKHGGQIESVALTLAEAKRIGEISKARRAAKAARRERRAAETEARKAEHAIRENPLPDIRAAIRYGPESRARGFDKHPGEQLPTKDIEAFLRSRGRDPETVAYLPHRGDVVGRRAYHAQQRPGVRPLDKAEARTGEAYRKGATETSAGLLRDQGVRQQVQLNQAHEQDRMIGEHGMRHPAWAKAQRGEQLTPYEKKVVADGGYYTPKEALETADRLLKDNDEYVVPVRAHAAALSQETRRVIRENLQGPGGMDSLGQRMLNDRLVTDGDITDRTSRNVVLMSGHLFDRLNDHLRPAGALQKFAQVLNRAFRYAVLPQFRWLTGNFVEPYLVRLTTKGSGVNVFGLGLDIAKSRTLAKRLRRSGDPRLRQLGLDLGAQTGHGLFVGSRGSSARRGLQDFPNLDRSVQKAYGKVVQKLPVMESFGQTTRVLLRGGAKAVLAPLKLFFAVNRHVIERGALHAGTGGFIRDEIQQFTGSWLQTLRTSEKAWQEVEKGLVNTPTQHRLTDELHQLLGKYESWSPMMRAIVQGPAPFIPWMLNAVRFVYWTMPAGHSALSSVIVKAGQAVEDDWKKLHADTPPGSLRQAIPNGRGGWVDLARYTPWGATVPVTEGDLNAITDQFYPQAQGTVSALRGKDPFGRDLKVKPTAANPRGQASGGDKARIAVNQTLEALVPYLSTGRRLREGGATAYANSTLLHPKVKKDTAYMSALRRTFDPFRPTYLKPPSSAKGAAKTAKALGLDAADLHDLRQAAKAAGGGLDKGDLEELRQLARGGG
jgi:hypothetical protein